MYVLPLLPPTRPWVYSVCDATLTLILSFPALYFWVVRPLRREIAERSRAEAELRLHRDQLEQTVGQRTVDLERTNEGLRHEVAERKRAQEALRESEEYNRSIIEGSRDCIKVLDLEGRLRGGPRPSTRSAEGRDERKPSRRATQSEELRRCR